MLLWWLAYKSRIAAWNQVCHRHTERRTWVSTSSITEPYSSQTMLNASHIPVRRLIIVTGGTTVTSQLPEQNLILIMCHRYYNCRRIHPHVEAHVSPQVVIHKLLLCPFRHWNTATIQLRAQRLWQVSFSN